MAMPVKEKTWSFSVNNIITAGTIVSIRKLALLQIKTIFLALGWTVRGSSDSVSAVACGGGSPDLWIDEGDIVYKQYDYQDRSWIVLRNENIDTELLIDCCTYGSSGYTNAETFTIYLSHVGFTGGTIAAIPTATDSISEEVSQFAPVTIDCTRIIVHGMGSSDGECTRIILTGARNGIDISSGLWFVDKVKDPASLWASPQVICHFSEIIGGGTYLKPRYVDLFEDDLAFANITKTGPTVLGKVYHYLTCEGYSSDAVGEKAIIMDQQLWSSIEYPLMPIGLVSETVGARGRNGMIYDMWWGHIAANHGDTYPDTGKTFAQFGHIIHPWDGSTPLIS